MCTNKFLIGGLRGVHDSNIVNWGYGDNFEPVYFFFFLRKDSARTKTLTNKKPTNKTKISEQKTTKVILFCAHKLLRGKSRLFCIWCFFTRLKSFRKKKINRFKIISVTSIVYTTAANFHNVTSPTSQPASPPMSPPQHHHASTSFWAPHSSK